MDTKEKNYWPLGILSVLLLGVLLVSALVVVAIKYTPKNDNSYLTQHTYTDAHINTMIAHYHTFLQNYNLTLQSDNQNLNPPFPYYLNPSTPLLHLHLKNNQMQLVFTRLQKVTPPLNVSVILVDMAKAHPFEKPKCMEDIKAIVCTLNPFNLSREGNYKILIKVGFNKSYIPLIQPAYARARK
ncbi:hypothetical protein [Helicobacter felis]|uniref:Inner membrane protein n=1 Tax=Helicobacter felis (strain ATCC 49179 / CCUG 28539 / NCTC 12436 / CS1) TaxID=936155 RepID=E7AAE0_HELFC|nr:hypothetical protein [Helicobacter felis]CBY83513.1 Putative inner membrane protein [Helicobacter felis ATCC 49179]